MNSKLIRGIAVTALVTAVLSFLLTFYLHINLLTSLCISLIYSLVISSLFHFYQKVAGFLKPTQAKVALWAFAHSLAIIVISALFSGKLYILPLMVIVTTLCWIIAAMKLTAEKTKILTLQTISTAGNNYLLQSR